MSLKSRFSEPGFVVSVAVHVAALGAALVSFSSVQKFDDVQETVPVEMVTDAQFNQIMRGEKTTKEVRPEAVAKAQQVDKVSEIKPTPVVPDQKRDAPAPPPPPPPPLPPVKQAMLDPEPPPPPVADLPPERPQTPPPTPTPPAPVPPVRNVEAEPVAPKPPEPPKPVPPLPPVAKPVPKPPLPPHPDAAKLHDKSPPPKPKAVERPKVDQLAKLMEEQPDDPAPATKPTPVKPAPSKSKPAPDNSENSKFDLTDITKLLLSHDAPAQRASRGPDTSHLASLGSPTASAAKMSPSLWAGLDGLLEDQYRQCWSYLGLTTGQKYIPQVRVVYGPNGGLQAEPVLINPPSDPALQNLADSALRAVRRCNPLKIPDQYAPYYELWKGRVLRFDPEEMAG